MSGMSEISILFGQHVWEIERARETFTIESRNFVAAVLESLRRARPDPWTTAKVRLIVQPELETNSKVTGYMRSQFALARANIKFKKGTNFVTIADVNFGLQWREDVEQFTWQINIVPTSRYPQLDDVLWRQWRGAEGKGMLPGATHESRANTICLCSRELSPELTTDSAYNDVKQAFDFLLSSEVALAEAVGLDLTPAEEAASSPVANA